MSSRPVASSESLVTPIGLILRLVDTYIESKHLMILDVAVISYVTSRAIFERYSLPAGGFKRGTENSVRDIAIYLVRRLCCKTLPDVGTEFGINNYSTVNSVDQRVKRRIERDRILQKELSIIEKKAQKSQKRT